MNNRISPAIVCGFAAAVICTIPGFKNLSCCLIIPLAAYMSLFVNQKVKGLHVVNTPEALYYGFFTGLSAALFSTVFEVIITSLTKSNELVAALPELEKTIKSMNMEQTGAESLKLLKVMINEITANGFSPLFAAFLLFGNLIIDIVFGIIGGLLGMAFLKKRQSGI